MFDRSKVIQALERKREQFLNYDIEQRQERQQLFRYFEKFRSRGQQSILDALDELAEPWPGALPTAEVDRADDMCLPFGQPWQNHQQARHWALATLYDRPVLAVDGSQITPTKDFSVPVGAVQIGWFLNEHRQRSTQDPSSYVKDVAFEVLSPAELGDDEDDLQDDFPNWRVNQQRFVRECEKLCELMSTYADAPEEHRPLCFFDGSFIVSFAGQLRPSRAQGYLRAVEQLLDCSQRYRIPLVGFVDSPYSRDLVTLIGNLYPVADLRQISDARLFHPVLSQWGDRSPLFICARPDSLSREGRVPFYREVCFTYVRLVQDRPPARLELPRWLLDEGRADDVIDLVRAESVVGVGYPYAIETADAVAVIAQQDRARFYRVFQQFLESEGLDLSIARKMRSKRSRR